MIVSTGTSVCTCPLGYAGRFCNIGKPLSFPSFMRQPWGMVSGGLAVSWPHGNHCAYSSHRALLSGKWYRVSWCGQHHCLRSELPGLEF